MDQGTSIECVVLAEGLALGAAIRLVAGHIDTARVRGVRRLLVIVPEGLATPSTAQRLEMVRTWAQAAGGRVRVAVVAPEALLDPQRVGEVAAAGFGLEGRAFSDEARARDWLVENA